MGNRATGNRTVLVSGAGIAGSTLAYWLARHGFEPTVVERSAGLRSSGSPVDVRGRAVDVAERMGLLPRIREAGTHVTDLTFVDDAGRRVGRVNLRALQRATGSREVELPRHDLAAILHEASRHDAEFLFHDSITALAQDADGVDVTFATAPPRRFDLVIGTDGLHSGVRRLVFGPESDLVEHMGLYVATMPLPGPAGNAHEVLTYNTPGTAVSVHPSRGGPLAAFFFRHDAVPDFDHRDTAQHRRLLAEAFGRGVWRVPELLAEAQAADDLFFDSVSRVSLPEWSRGRVALVGDAASCVSLFGDGSTLAMAGAATLAEALAARADDHRAAFRAYETAHRVLVEPKQRSVSVAAAMLVPTTRTGIVIRNLATRLWPVLAAAGSVNRLRPGRRATTTPSADTTTRADTTEAPSETATTGTEAVAGREVSR
jgi:2-polyprenyl-6-methoxyphenol hydroxylase-like FAD-dependent oxidoreductase